MTDSLDRRHIAAAVARVVSSCETPMVLGLYGTWGVGKTSLMKLVESELEASGSVVTVWFDAWQHQFDENPAVALLHKMTEELRLGEEGRRLLFAIAGAFNEVVLKLTAGVAVKDLQELQQQYDEERFLVREKQIRLRDHFGQLLRKASSGGQVRIVFFIDDLDRCLPENILTVLEALKLFLNIPGCVYVLGVDRQALERSIKQKYPDSEVSEVAYLDKIVQLPFVIPPVSGGAVEKYIRKLLPEGLISAIPLLSKGIGDNPRQIKRYVNSLVLNYELAATDAPNDNDPAVLAAMLLLQLRSPEIYKDVALDPGLLQAPRDEWLADSVVTEVLSTLKKGSPALLRRYVNLSESAAVRDVTYDVMLTDAGETKIQIIKILRELVTGLGLKDAKDLVDSVANGPVSVLSGVSREQALAAQSALQDHGATVELH